MESSNSSNGQFPVDPTRPPAKYIGGKRNLSRRLTALIAATPHQLYAEPFVGMGGVFFRRTTRPRVEVVNDISEDVITLMRILQRHYQAFLDMLRWRFASRAEFDRLMRVDPSTCTDLERAARFLYLQRTAYGGKVVGRHFGIDTTNRSAFRLSQLEPMLQELHDRLDGVTIERLPFDTFIQKWDRPGTLFYLDPPYLGSEEDYGASVFSGNDFVRLRDRLSCIAGRFILSINDVPQIRTMFAAFRIEPVEVTYRLSGGATAGRELIISSA